MTAPPSNAPRVLIVDDDRNMIVALSRALTGVGEVRFATSGKDAMRLALQTLPDLILLDIELPDGSGFDLCRAMKQNAQLADVPIIFVTSHDETKQEIAGLNAGAVDFISKPPCAPVVEARVRTHLRLKEMSDSLRRQATTDGLTQIANRRQFDEVSMREWLRAQRTGVPLSLALVDIDFFKQYNDHYGHQEGDQCLRRVAQMIQSVARRPTDLGARIGGEEFAMLLPDTNARGAEGVAQRLMHVLEESAIPHATSSVSEFVSVSVGLASYEAPSHFAATSDSPPCVPHEWPEFAALLATADRALYAAKQSGRRRACMLALNAPADQAQTVARGGSHDPARPAVPLARPR